ncbi:MULTISPECIES: hypothetical protein [unclassified Bradyrhizobium]|uniref:hypothetical protein n=1 Tax=unclassified Bradyrhizobium TaxID=2631580 RepID=UPI0020132170|nr:MULTISPECIES: hypothetical protein [unclassified Bradyrhizobium]
MKARLALLACVATIGMALSSSGASAAMPNGLQGVQTPVHTDQVRWVCNPWRCWWRPNYYYGYGYGPGYGYYGGPRYYYGGGWGYRRGWGGGWGGGWHGGWHHRHW